LAANASASALRRFSHPTASEHLKILSQASLIRGKRIKQWTFYKRDESTIRKLKKRYFPMFRTYRARRKRDTFAAFDAVPRQNFIGFYAGRWCVTEAL
jgi:DNA-binding transcriptional ArsR family regulator